MPSEPRWISFDEIVIVHDRYLDPGEPESLRDPSGLDSALNVPINLFHYEGERRWGVLAGRLMLAVSDSQAFIQGNKRAAFFGASIFLRMNGWKINLSDTSYFGRYLVAVAERKKSRDQFLRMMKLCTVPITPKIR